ncbi:hypothetical protein CLAFUW4_06796 [Fulvia fulva]|uniref:N-acetylgalactosaminide beta-1,3-galactosyltransferase n=1 Tax=Passalora fulva TaxID=5499 RepID=A0A9Q8UQZ2_PASFU|nr:uncharacterized protein CLAFUR5_06933 [Fulvia fulva]KAK4621990.1 hypothetical protein CLAFUR4_06804 [Fulvia fulva]KAK4623254.1 hypothetical protein CLAFUR0_06799 [Fulvia fulva]UJO19254.1 hypothetical protein CLAFUR5_06933 [Fulvia fulva]WPV16128.1 hypothetical protein CLAFUW4_06796 [Fulvia fulva]WPV30844.1 hypothetical protein CLAFUW7_06795 [Fulvia fulva]
MVRKTYEMHPTAKWYIFTDADTWVSPTNLVNWLGRFDHSKQWYLGNPSVIGQQGFAHGGSGYILSKSAMNTTSDLYSRESQYWDRFAAKHWAGDCVLATALQHRLNIPVSWAYPLLQSESPFMLDYTEQNYYRKLWCYPVVSYHHASPSTIETLWVYEKNWTARHHTSVQPMKHRDVFRDIVMPRFREHDQQEWQNLSGDIVPSRKSDEPPNFDVAAVSSNLRAEQYLFAALVLGSSVQDIRQTEGWQSRPEGRPIWMVAGKDHKVHGRL